MIRYWTDETARAWMDRRDALRKKKGLRSMDDLRSSIHPKDRGDYEKSLDVERSLVLERLRSYYTKTVAWELGKEPLNQYPAPFSGTLHLPLHLHQSKGTTKIRFHEGDDLNRIVNHFYCEKVDAAYGGVNFAMPDGLSLSPTRHEYLGPAPYVVGFQFSIKKSDALVEWWDVYLQQKWVGKGRWEFEVYFDEMVQGWVSRPRGDFDCSLDVTEYLGCK